MNRLTCIDLRDSENMGGYTKKKYVTVQQLIDKLAHYEDLEEKGLLVELPCKVGNIVYLISEDCGGDTIDCRYQDCTRCIDFHRYVEGNNFELYMLDEIGKTVFLTESEAEQALKEMNDKEE